MKAKSIFLGSTLALITGASAVSFAQGTDVSAPQETQSKAQQQAVTSGTEKGKTFESMAISFDEGSASLTDQDKSSIRDLAKKMSEQGKISEAKLAVWSDKAHPTSGDLPKADRELAQKRISSIESFLKKEAGVTSVKAFNMTENRNWVGRMFHREQAELDAAFAKKGETPVTNPEFQAIKSEGGPSKAVVILEHKTKK